MTVIDFPIKKSYVFQCGCGCQSFFLYDNNTAECCACGDFAGVEGCWAESKPGRSSENTLDHEQASDKTVIEHCDDRFTFLRGLKNANVKNTRAVVILNDDGGVFCWRKSRFETEEAKEWLKNKIKDAHSLLIE